MPRVVYNPESVRFWHDHLVSQQTGYGLPVFIGQPYQRGFGLGSFLRSLWRSAVPIFKKAAKAVGKQALSSGADIIADVAIGKQILPALEARGKEAVSALADRAAKHLRGQEGSDIGFRPASMVKLKLVSSGPLAIGGRKVRGKKRQRKSPQTGSGSRRRRRVTRKRKSTGKKRKSPSKRRRRTKQSRDIFG